MRYPRYSRHESPLAHSGLLDYHAAGIRGMNATLLLFDVDGTLMLSGGAGMRAMRRTAQSLFGDYFSWQGVEPDGKLDPMILAEAAARNGIDDVEPYHDRFHNRYIQTLAEELTQNSHRVRVLPGVADLIENLRQRRDDHGDVTLGLLTGNYSHAVPLKLQSIDMQCDWFTITAFGDEAATRPGLVALAMRRYQKATGELPEPRRVIVIGDTPRDVDCAHAHGCVAFAVATGQYDASQLADAGAEVVVDNLADPSPLMRLLSEVTS